MKHGPIGIIAFAALSSAMLTLAAVPLPSAAERVRLEYPGLRIYTHEGRVRAVYGRPMTAATTPAESAQLWWERHAESFGVAALELRLAEQRQLGQTEEFTVQRYDQFIDGVPVEAGGARLLVRNDRVWPGTRTSRSTKGRSATSRATCRKPAARPVPRVPRSRPPPVAATTWWCR